MSRPLEKIADPFRRLCFACDHDKLMTTVRQADESRAFLREDPPELSLRQESEPHKRQPNK
jgi:hypothetical protein